MVQPSISSISTRYPLTIIGRELSQKQPEAASRAQLPLSLCFHSVSSCHYSVQSRFQCPSPPANTSSPLSLFLSIAFTLPGKTMTMEWPSHLLWSLTSYHKPKNTPTSKLFIFHIRMERHAVSSYLFPLWPGSHSVFSRFLLLWFTYI